MSYRQNAIDRVSLTMRRGLRRLAFLFVTLVGGLVLLAACAAPGPGRAGDPPGGSPEDTPDTYQLPTPGGDWDFEAEHTGDAPSGTGSIDIAGIGSYEFDATEVQTVRPDIFQESHFSLFDILVYLSEQGEIDLEYHFDEQMDTHVIDSLDGQSGWWYEAYYSAGWYENNAFRMDKYPYKDNMQIRLFQERQGRIDDIYQSFREETERLEQNDGRVVVPAVTIQGPDTTWRFEDVVVEAHGVRDDVLQPDVITALDILLSLGEQGELLNIELTWYEEIAGADPVDSYWVSAIEDAQSAGGCGFVYEVGARQFAGFRGAHIHIPTDVRALVSPEYALWFWICL